MKLSKKQIEVVEILKKHEQAVVIKSRFFNHNRIVDNIKKVQITQITRATLDALIRKGVLVELTLNTYVYSEDYKEK